MTISESLSRKKTGKIKPVNGINNCRSKQTNSSENVFTFALFLSYYMFPAKSWLLITWIKQFLFVFKDPMGKNYSPMKVLYFFFFFYLVYNNIEWDLLALIVLYKIKSDIKCLLPVQNKENKIKYTEEIETWILFSFYLKVTTQNSHTG